MWFKQLQLHDILYLPCVYMQSSRLSFHHPMHKWLHLYSQITLNLQSFKLKSHYVEFGVSCDLVPPHRFSVQQVITNLSFDRRNEDDNYKQNLLRHNNVLYWTLLCWSGRVCVCDAVIRPSSTEFIMSPHHKFFFLFSSSCLQGARLAGGDAGRPDGTNTRKLCGVFIVQETTRSGHDGTEVDQNWTVED